MKFSRQDQILLFCYLVITSFNLAFRNNLSFITAMNMTILIGVSVFWIIIEIMFLIKDLKENEE